MNEEFIKMSKILVSTVHHPNINVEKLELITSKLGKLFDKVCITISTVTSESIKECLLKKELYCAIVIEPKGAADARRKALKLAVNQKFSNANYL